MDHQQNIISPPRLRARTPGDKIILCMPFRNCANTAMRMHVSIFVAQYIYKLASYKSIENLEAQSATHKSRRYVGRHYRIDEVFWSAG